MSMSQFLILLKKLVTRGVNRMEVLIVSYFMIKLMTKDVICLTFNPTTLNWRRKIVICGLEISSLTKKKSFRMQI